MSARCYLWSFLERITLWRLQNTFFPLGDWTSECDQENTCNWFTLACLLPGQNWPTISPPMRAKIYSNFPSAHRCVRHRKPTKPIWLMEEKWITTSHCTSSKGLMCLLEAVYTRHHKDLAHSRPREQLYITRARFRRAQQCLHSSLSILHAS